MAKGTVFDPERIVLRDRRSDVNVICLTHHPTITSNLYFEMCSFTRDDRYVVVVAQRLAGREAPWDLLRARTDGLELVQLTDCDDLSGIAICPSRGSVFYQSNGELHELNIVTLDEQTVAKAPGETPTYPQSLASVDERGEQYFGSCRNADGRALLFRVETATGKLDVLHESDAQNHIHVDPDGRLLRFGDVSEGQIRSLLIDADGAHLRPYPGEHQWLAHCTWFGRTGRMQGTLLPPGQALVTYIEGDEKPTVLTAGRYYWHSSASADAQWIVADTNWPQEGLYLLHVPSGTVTYVCDPQSSCSHPQWTHPHPSLSPGLNYVLFNSDMTGIGQVYLAELTEEFIAQAAKGYACKPSTLGP